MSDLDRLYFEFEERYRGSRDLIRARFETYRPLLSQLLDRGGPIIGLDAGCGRGEWLEFSREVGFDLRGIDLNRAMLDACVARGLPATHGDAVVHLESLAADSLGLVSAFHVVEHMKLHVMQAFLRAAFRALAPGGVLLIETPNPENVHVGTATFYLDPTHQRPLPPGLLRFIVESAGFDTPSVLRLNGLASGAEGSFTRLLRRPYESAPDYAVIACKRGDSAARDGVAAFAQERSQAVPVDMSETESLDARWTAIQTLAQGTSEQLTSFSSVLDLLARRTDTAGEASVTLKQRVDVLERSSRIIEAALIRVQQALAAEEAARREIEAVRREVEAERDAMAASRSWRVTAPLRALHRLLTRRP